jgi:hypothetical protein
VVNITVNGGGVLLLRKVDHCKGDKVLIRQRFHSLERV